MIQTATTIEQAAVIAALAQRQPGLGRTGLMKYLYLLQTVMKVPLGFDFSLYAYGPYDSAVLSRIATAERWGAVDERSVRYPSGTGYAIYPGQNGEELKAHARAFLNNHAASLEWVCTAFHSYTAAGMELIGTMVYADREAAEQSEQRTKEQLVRTTLAIKPRFSPVSALQIYDKLKELGALIAVQDG